MLIFALILAQKPLQTYTDTGGAFGGANRDLWEGFLPSIKGCELGLVLFPCTLVGAWGLSVWVEGCSVGDLNGLNLNSRRSFPKHPSVLAESQVTLTRQEKMKSAPFAQQVFLGHEPCWIKDSGTPSNTL